MIQLWSQKQNKHLWIRAVTSEIQMKFSIKASLLPVDTSSFAEMKESDKMRIDMVSSLLNIYV